MFLGGVIGLLEAGPFSTVGRVSFGVFVVVMDGALTIVQFAVRGIEHHDKKE